MEQKKRFCGSFVFPTLNTDLDTRRGLLRATLLVDVLLVPLQRHRQLRPAEHRAAAAAFPLLPTANFLSSPMHILNFFPEFY